MNIRATGKLLCRITANRLRMSDGIYRNPDMFYQENGGWDGDWEGRDLLCLCSLYRVCSDGDRSGVMEQIEDVVAHLGEHINEHGYFGPVYDGRTVNEQQLSGNSWFIRGLCEYYKLTGSGYAKKLIEKIRDNYLIRLCDYYPSYPLCERENGDVSGHLQKSTTGNWLLSSDVGCAFIMLDGVTAAYELFPTEALRRSLETVLENYLKIDFAELKCQTHATLSGLRGMLRYYRLTGADTLVPHARRIFKLYTDLGMTLNYANLNWFGRPDTWTEPCAVVDSMMVAMQLFEITGDEVYIETLNRIIANALPSAQRSSGGAGCDTCVTAEQDGMKMSCYEAFFCCNMRLGEGLRSLAEFLAVKRDGRLYLPIIDSFTAEENGLNIRVSAEGDVCRRRITIDVAADNPERICLYLPPETDYRCDFDCEAEGRFLRFTAKSGRYVIDYAAEPHFENRFGRRVGFIGDTLLSRKNGGGDFTPIADFMDIASKEYEVALVQQFWQDVK